MKIYLVRHGKDEDGYRGGWSQRGLVEEGIEQSLRLGRYLQTHREAYGIRTLMASDLPRATETARQIERATGLSCACSQEWREMNNGVLAGMPHALAEAEYPGIYFNTLEMDTPFPGGETPAHFYDRICRTFNQLCERIESGTLESNVLVVTHGGVINILYYLLNGEKWTNRSAFHPIDQASLHTVTKTALGWQITEPYNHHLQQ